MEAQPPPPGFRNLVDASQLSNEMLHVIGIVTDVMPPRQSNGKDWVFTFSIHDGSLYGIGQKVRFFASNKDMPPIQEPREIVILRNLRRMVYQGMVILISNVQTQWTIFSPGSIPARENPTNPANGQRKSVGSPQTSDEELKYVMYLKKEQDLKGFAPLASGTVLQNTCNPRQKFSLLQDIKIDSFCDLVGLVVKLFPSGEKLALYISDYTKHPFLFNYEPNNDRQDECDKYSPKPARQWQGPLGKQSLQVTLFPPHSHWASSNVKEGKFVFLRNVRIKASRYASGIFEGVLHSDRMHEGRIDVHLVTPEDNDHAKNVLRRKRDYERENRKDNRNDVQGQSSKQQTAPAREPASGGKKNRKKKKKAKKASALEQQNQKSSEVGFANAKNIINQLNPNIKCRHPDHSIRSVFDIVTGDDSHSYTTQNGNTGRLPFQNIISRAQLRVVDFKPDDLADFTRRRLVSEYDILTDDGEDSGSIPEEELPSSSPDSHASDSNAASKHKWEWVFSLLLEDASPGCRVNKNGTKDRMIAYVALDDAVYLLKLDPKDLRKNPQTLSQLREKLFILWGDLEERKTQGREATQKKRSHPGDEKTDEAQKTTEETNAKDSNGAIATPLTRPFSCLIAEYGQKLHGRWLKRFRIIGTTIS